MDMEHSACGDPAAEYLDAYYDILRRMEREMTSAEMTGSISRDFIVQMIPHHEGAVRMSENALCHCICRPLRPILENIIAVQKRETGEMRGILAEME